MEAPRRHESPLGRRRGFFPALVSTLLNPKYHFALLFVSSFSTKLLHLYTHRDSLPILLSLLYLPTFLLPDFLLIVLGHFLYRPKERSPLGVLRRVAGATLAIGTTGASSSWVSFYFETGGEIPWVAAGNVASDSQGIQVLLSGLTPALIVCVVYLFESWIIAPYFCKLVDNFFGKVHSSFCCARRPPWLKSKLLSQYGPVDQEEFPEPREVSQHSPKRNAKPSVKFSLAVITAAIVCVVLEVVRPRHPPYDHLSGTIPFTVVGAILFNPVNSEFCLRRPVAPVDFPYDDVFVDYQEEPPEGLFPGWAPKSSACSRGEEAVSGDDERGPSVNHPPPHDPEHPPPPPGPGHRPPHRGPRHRRPPPGRGHGHPRLAQWFEHLTENEEEMFDKLGELYQPQCDPLKVRNLDLDLLEPLQVALTDSKPAIRNVVLITLESTRKDVFPFKKEGNAYDQIVASYKGQNGLSELNQKLSSLSQVAEILTGEPSGFGSPAGNGSAGQQKWRGLLGDTMGGLNVKNAITGSTWSLKSWLVSHCGIEPLPVDLTEEAKRKIYQLCIPQILDLFNKQLGESSNSSSANADKREGSFEFRSSEWDTVLMQSVTERFDSQDELDKHIGFGSVIDKDTLLDPSSKYFPPKLPQTNYFGFPETELLPYLRDAFSEAKKNNRRLFLSHLTSTTHHPHHPPKSWGEGESYVPSGWGNDETYDHYLNTVKYQDEWIGKVFDVLEETGAIDETLVVILGDHGVAFETPDKSFSNVQNGHVSNFRIPFLFVHPHLPRIQIDAKTTPIAIVPTIMDLLVETGSLNTKASATAKRLMRRYQGQSLIRPFDSGSSDGREPWYFGTTNPGGSLIAISSASSSYRLALPLCSTAALRFTDTDTDPAEHDPMTEWTLEKLRNNVRERHGKEAEDWLVKAEKLGRWWFWEQHERWNYHKAARSTDRGAEGNGGRVSGKAWWET